MIGAVHEALRAMLHGDGKIPPGLVDITFAIPTRDWAASISRPTINFYLYDISENVKLRDSEFGRVRTDASERQRLRPRRVDLKYVITAHFKSQLPELEAEEWQVLWRVLATLMRNTDWPDALQPREAVSLGTFLQAQVASPEGAPRLGEIWSALGASPRPSLHYVITVPIDLNIEFMRSLVVELGIQINDAGTGEQMVSLRRYGWTIRDAGGHPLAGAEVRIPDAPGLSVSAENGVFTTTLPHADTTQFLVRPQGQSGWSLLDTVPGSQVVSLPSPSRQE